MKITLITVGKIKEKYWLDAIAEYSKRLSRYCRLEIIQVQDEKTPDGADALPTASSPASTSVSIVRFPAGSSISLAYTSLINNCLSMACILLSVNSLYGSLFTVTCMA